MSTPSSSGWFRSKETSRSLPARPKQREPFNWISDSGVEILLKKRIFGDDNFFTVLTGVPFPVEKPGELDVVANSVLAEEFISHVEDNLRNFGTTVTSDKEVSAAELRGPVMWSETLSVRAASFGMDYVHVCSVQKRTYDSPENRVVAAALTKLVECVPREWRNEETSTNRRAVRVANNAEKILSQKPFNGVAVVHPKKLVHARKKARNSRRPELYGLALEVLDAPVNVTGSEMATIGELVALCDNATKARSNLAVELLERLSRFGFVEPEVMKVEDGVIFLGEVALKGGPAGFVSFAGIQILTPVDAQTKTPSGELGGELGGDHVTVQHPDDLIAVMVKALHRATGGNATPRP